MNANFKEIHSAEELDEIFRQSDDKPVVLFKHSITCPISYGVYQEVAKLNADVNLIVVQRARSVSTYVAEKTGIRHESPQAIVLKDGKPVYHASHFDITAPDIDAKLKM